MKYRNTFRRSPRTARAAALCLALAATLVALAALAGHAGFSASSAQEPARKPQRVTKLGARPGVEAAARQRATRGAKSAKGDAAAPVEQTAALLACDATGAGTPINFGQTLNGQLTADDCDFGDGTRYDIYRFDATAGQQVSVTMSSSAFDTFLFLVYDINGNGVADAEDAEFGEVGEDDDGGGSGSTNSRIPSGSGVATLPFTGRYFIIANAFPPEPPNTTVPTGNYAITLSNVSAACGATATTPGAGAINGSLGSPDCRFTDDSFFDIYSFTGNAGQQISITLNATLNNGGAGIVYLLDFARNPIAIESGPARIPGSGLVTLPSTGTYFVVAGSTPRTETFNPTPTGTYTLTIAAAGQCSTTSINVGQTINSTLASGDCLLPDNTLADFYTFSGTAGQQIAISLDSTAFDAYLFLNNPSGVVIAENDDSGGTFNSRIPASGFFTLPVTGTYTILANTFPGDPAQPPPTGAYTLNLFGPAPASANIQLSAGALSAMEGVDRSVVVTVTRGGDTTGTSFVSYATTDGTASERKDYTAALGRLRFGPGETSKTFEIVITDDAFAEGQETFTVALSNPVGATLGATTSATVTINSNDAANGVSPVRDAAFNTEFFVRQHYADFLNRVPDTGGLAFWMNGIDSCGANQQCREVKKIDTSAAFFLSIEFQETGFLAVRTHKVAFGDLMGKPVPLTLRSFLADSRQLADNVIVGTPGWPEQLEANKVAYFNEFVTRPAFIALNPLSLTAEQYVDGLFARANVLPTQAERNAAINAFNTSRAAALRSVAESQTVRQAETNKAFVLMQYFGYLRRNPDDPDFQNNPDPQFLGYTFWLNKLNQFGGNYVDAEMVKAFISSIEYGDRFGQ